MNFNCIILSGGKSSRLNTDKALVHYQGKSLLQRLVNNVLPFVQEVSIISNDEHHKIEGTTFLEENHEKIGPLGGLKVGLQNSNTDWNLVLSVDMPLLNINNLIQKLVPNVSDSFKAIIPKSEEQHQYVAGFYHRDISESINIQLGKGEFSLKQLFQQNNHIKTIESSLDFSNINTIKDIENIGCKFFKIISFGQVQEKIGANSFFIISNSKTLDELQKEIRHYYPSLSDTTFRIAINQSFEKEDYLLKSGDELALLPPFAGG